jgi:thiosulfate/3-mercaptopyruvate sulfurtransferase
MKLLAGAALVAAVTGLAGSASAQVSAAARDRVVVSVAWLADHLHDPDLVLLHVGVKETYDAGHIPGARFADYRGALAATGAAAGGLSLEVPPPEVLRERLAALGISDHSRVVVYRSDDYLTPSTRVMLTLDRAGLSNVSWLDGGQKAWTAAGHPLSTEVPAVTPGTLGPLRLRPVVVDAEFVKAHLSTPGFVIVDARNASFYDGSSTGGRDEARHKTGHIAGAVSVPFDSFTDAEGLLKPSEDVAAAFSKAGVKPGDTVIVYCHIGQQATATLFAARTLGYKAVLYDGSFEDWSKRDLPVENPTKK